MRRNDSGPCQTKGESFTKSNKTGFLALSMLGILLLSLPGTACADWSLPMTVMGSGISKIELFIMPGNAPSTVFWSNTGAADFHTGFNQNTSWGAEKLTSSYVLATGNATSGRSAGLSFDLLFTDPAGGKHERDFRVDYIAYSASGALYGYSLLIENGKFKTGNGSVIQLNPDSFAGYNRGSTSVPIPPTAVLLGVGLFGMVLVRKRMHR